MQGVVGAGGEKSPATRFNVPAAGDKLNSAFKVPQAP